MAYAGRVVQHVDGGALSRVEVLIVLIVGEQQVLDVLRQVPAIELDPVRVDLLAPVVVEPGEPRRVLVFQVLAVPLLVFVVVVVLFVIVMSVILDSGR